jgi:hypothetical protein
MQQTLISLLALLLVTLLSFNQQQASIQSQQQIVRAEMEQMALGVAMQTMEVVRARQFDAGIEESSRDEIVNDPDSTLTDTTYFGKKYKGGNAYSSGVKDCKFRPEHTSKVSCSFVEEFHTTKGTVPFSIGDNEEGDEEIFKFFVRIEVQYVGENFDPSVNKELQKKVDIFVQDDPSEGSPRLPEPIRYSEVFSYP